MSNSLAEFREWCIVELMGHVRIGGFCTEVERFGQKMLQIEIFRPGEPPVTQLIGGSALYRVTVASEDKVVSMYQTRQTHLSIGKDVDYEDVDEDCDDVDYDD